MDKNPLALTSFIFRIIRLGVWCGRNVGIFFLGLEFCCLCLNIPFVINLIEIITKILSLHLPIKTDHKLWKFGQDGRYVREDSKLVFHSYKPDEFLPWQAAPKLRRLVAGFPPRWPGFAPGSGQVGFVVDRVSLGQVFSDYFGISCQCSFHHVLHPHNHPGRYSRPEMADVPSGCNG
jgi:hypothetical protein